MIENVTNYFLSLPLPVQVGAVALATIYFSVILWTHYLAIMALKRQRDNGKLTKTAQTFAVPTIVVGVLMDVVYNLIVGTAVFRELPREWLFTDRLQRHLEESDGFRLRRAKWFCRHFLDPFDPDGKHC